MRQIHCISTEPKTGVVPLVPENCTWGASLKKSPQLVSRTILRSSLAAAILLTTLPSARSQDDEKKLFEPKHVAKTRQVTASVVSPDGNTIAYTLAVPREPIADEDGPAWSELHVTDLQGNSRPYVRGDVSVGKPAWSPDGRWIYYLAKRDGDEATTLYRIPLDGGESLRVLEHPTSIASFDLSPDGRSVVFVAKEEPAENQVELEDQGFTQEIYEEDWKLSQVWIAETDPNAYQVSLEDDPRKLELSGSATDVQWSPSGRELMVVLTPTPSVDDSYMRKRVHVVDVDSGRVIKSIDNRGKLGQVAWSPSGKWLALVSGVDENDPREGRLMVASVDDGPNLRDLIPGIEGHIDAVEWKDDSTLYWLASDGVSSRFGTVTIDAERSDLIEPGSGPVFHAFSIGRQHQTISLLGEAPEHPSELYAFTGPADSPRRLTTSNPWLEEMRFARQTPVRWQARDGLALEGVLIYPLNYVKGRSYPTIMYVHGGPESHVSDGWLTSYSRPGQVAAARGFAVFYPNYRGSTGRGLEFSKLGQADAAGAEFDDLIDGVDYLIDLGVTDRDAVGVTGGSYGGYASAWCSTFYSDRFAASVMFVGISNNVSKVGTTDIPDEMFLVHHRKRLWDDFDYFLERSPIRYVERNKTPTLIMHGKEDPRVHPSQSLELYRHLKTLNQAPVRLVLYEGEGHGNRKAAARLDYNLRMLRWMEHFLQDDGETSPELEIDYFEALGIPREE